MNSLERRYCRPRRSMRFHAGSREYELEGRVGDGAVGLVRKAKDLESGRTVAVKFLAPDPKYIEPEAFGDVAHRFRREGMRGAGLIHENLVRTFAYEDNEGGACFANAGVQNPFLVMEYVKGKTLESLIKKASNRAPPHFINAQSMSIAARIARALLYLHQLKIVHRDVKPANIFLSSNRVGSLPNTVKLGDFGVTKWGDFKVAVSSGSLTTLSQRGLGTLKYMSPEQAVRPKEVSVRSDMFSLGITAFELFAGQILPSAHHVFEIMSARQSRGTVTSKLRSVGLSIPFEHEDVMELVLDMFLTSPAGRPTSKQAAARFEFYAERRFGLNDE